MDGSQRSLMIISGLLATLTGSGFCFHIIQGPSNSTVLRGSTARFNCTVTTDWKVLIWIAKGTPVLTTVPTTGAIITNSQFIQQNYTTLLDFTSELMITDVAMADSGWIECNLQTSGSAYAYLSVQVYGTLGITNADLQVTFSQTTQIFCEASAWYPVPLLTWLVNNTSANPLSYVTHATGGSDGLWNATSTLNLTALGNSTITCQAAIDALPEPQSITVNLTVRDSAVDYGKTNDNREVIIIAVTVSITALLLLILLILIIICCCKKRRKASSYQSELRKVSAEKSKNKSSRTKDKRGKENPGYFPELPEKQGPLPEYHYPLPASFPEQESNSEVIFKPKVPDGPDRTFDPELVRSRTSPAKTRHITHV
ncbi:immunoglobulin superfamily member 5 [Microcaecilia unicolor]|uniref:immunoglobulin superfamily member 5 n=1 Tax=Microcaecilia unicolor TaxID=1415580 RepID=UPI001185FAB3|nr:immunoglobulin superfamily member 5 [Microcaecilia unicolor]